MFFNIGSVPGGDLLFLAGYLSATYRAVWDSWKLLEAWDQNMEVESRFLQTSQDLSTQWLARGVKFQKL